MKTYFMQIEREIPEWPLCNIEESTITFSEEPLKPHYIVRLETKHNGQVFRDECTTQYSFEISRKYAAAWLLEKIRQSIK